MLVPKTTDFDKAWRGLSTVRSWFRSPRPHPVCLAFLSSHWLSGDRGVSLFVQANPSMPGQLRSQLQILMPGHQELLMGLGQHRATAALPWPEGLLACP